ncbi:tripartite motif-containing protein 45-like [Mytilus californianus]|uniref:tripartite motif-containing protein 45-like n=1 Tax=Mytilus californianus TaxID=6549 RepID=UPI002247C47F|nr:tripartite motif-containing protein 45-like [Mytilus californianus]
MATSLNVKEEHIKEEFADLLMCTICLETFKQPKYLPCLHTFCESCLSTYIVSTVKEEKPEGFKCPVCRRLVPVGDSKENPDTWARTLPGNHFVVSLIDRRAMKKAEKFCDACSSKSVSKEAILWCTVCEEAYCETCEANHKTFKATRNHKIIPIKDINEDKSISIVYAFVTCDEHPDKTIEIYCKDHSQPCCTVCATVHHRKCEHVVTIDKAITGVKESTKAQKVMKKLEETSNKLEGIIQNRHQNTTNFKKEIDVVEVEIANMRKKLNEKLDKVENEIREEVNNTRKSNLLKLSEESTELSALKSTFDHWKTIFEACLSQGSEIQCLVKMEEIFRKIPQFENDIGKVIQGIKDISVKFEATDISNAVCFGHLQYNEQRPSFLGFKDINLHTGKIKVLFTIDITGKFISGIFFNDDIIITDCNKNRIVYHDNTGKQMEVLNISEGPFDITKVNDQTAAVSSGAKKIYIINVKPLTLVKTLNVDVSVWGLCLVEDEFITANQSKTISWLNAETGSKIKELTIGYDPRFVTCNPKSEYIYRKGEHSVEFISAVGKNFQYNHSKLKYPFNQEIDQDGNIYVVGYGSHNIHQLSPAGELIRIIPLSDINNEVSLPWVMRFKRNTNRFLLTFHASAGPVLVCEIE